MFYSILLNFRPTKKVSRNQWGGGGGGGGGGVSLIPIFPLREQKIIDNRGKWLTDLVFNFFSYNYNARVTPIAKSANASVHPVTYYYYKNKGDTNDLKEVM